MYFRDSVRNLALLHLDKTFIRLVPGNAKENAQEVVNPSVLFTLHVNRLQEPMEIFQEHVRVHNAVFSIAGSPRWYPAAIDRPEVLMEAVEALV